MEQLRRLHGLDAAFLYMETPSQHMHVTGTMVFESSPATPMGRLTGFLVGRLLGLPAFHSRLLAAPLGIAHPAWVDATRFRPLEHVRHATVAAPGTLDELARLVGRIAATPLDRTRPLWELWAIDGLTDHRFAFVLKVHHAILDGISGLGVMAQLFTPDPDDDGTNTAPCSLMQTAARPDGPSAASALASALTSAAQGPARMLHTIVRTGRSLVPLARSSIEIRRSGARPVLPFSAPRTRLNGALTAERAVAFGRVRLDTVLRIKRAFGVTVNDVVLAACARALAEYLAACGERPTRPLVASVPVSEHAAGETTTSTGAGNHVSAMFVGLPVHLQDVVEMLHAVHEQAAGAKKVYSALGREMLADWAELAPPALFAGAAALYSRWKLADHLPPAHSVVISNVPGPPIPLYAGGVRLAAAYPLGPVLEGAAVNITVLSYAGSVDVGLITCPNAVPDPSQIARGFESAVDELARIVDMAGTQPATAFG